ncbi:Aste57867_23859 [Aphanomyces stellatus]|uniref:Aste57867_23859 protein n=1 Tax=Aphanomyces stellatus TaxID=120398 RepID=A0A485LNX9_9STRA|nr:hypothetical protein As57867_023786 [Aphanomyces stellatus]VFU00502.1 Aste57867_23859 [Aphanomyces stellatus]
MKAAAAAHPSHDAHLLYILRVQNIAQSRVWRGILVVIGLFLGGLMLYQAPGTDDDDDDGFSQRYIATVFKLAALGYVGEAALVAFARQTTHPLVLWLTRAALILSWLVSGLTYSMWHRHVLEEASTFMAIAVMGPSIFAAVCWFAGRELLALDAELHDLHKIAPS